MKYSLQQWWKLQSQNGINFTLITVWAIVVGDTAYVLLVGSCNGGVVAALKRGDMNM